MGSLLTVKRAPLGSRGRLASADGSALVSGRPRAAMGSSSPAHQLEAYLGLVPREFSSDDGQHRGAITKAGPGHTRWLLIQAAVSIIRRLSTAT